MKLNAKHFKITASIDIFDYTLDLMEVFPANVNVGYVTKIAYCSSMSLSQIVFVNLLLLNFISLQHVI